MTFKELIKKLKDENKAIAAEIKELKSKRKSFDNGYVPSLSGEQQEYRIKHIAYCLLRGTPFESIEPKWREPDNYNNQWCKKKAIELHKNYEAMIKVEVTNEVVHTS